MSNIFNKLFFNLIYLYMIVLPLAPSKYKYKSIPLNGDVILALIIVMYFIRISFSEDTRARLFNGIKDFLTDYLTISLSVLSFIMIISIFYSSDKKIALSESARFISFVMLFFILKYELHDKRTLDNIIKTYIFVCFLVFSIGIINCFSNTYVMNNNSLTLDRVKSTLENSNNLGAFAVLSVFPLVVLFLEQKDKIKKILYFIVSILAMLNIVLSQSRNALIAFAIGCLILCFIYSYKFIIAFVLMGGIAYVVPQIHSRLLQITDSNQNEARLKIWEIAFKIIKEHPIFGIGNGNFRSAYKQYIIKYPELKNKYGGTDIYHPHNIILKFQSELGILGTFAFISIAVSIPFKLKKFIRNTDSNFYKSFYKGFFISFVVFIFMNMIDNFFSVPKVIAFSWILIAVTQCLSYNSQFKDYKTIA